MVNCLNLGCGYNFHPDWVNVDFTVTGTGVIAHDLKQGIPFADQSFDLVYHSHVLEHFPKALADNFIKECYRVLRPGGVIRIVVPDLEQITRQYLNCLELGLNTVAAAHGAESEIIAAEYDWVMLELLDQAVRHYSGGDMISYLTNLSPEGEQFVLSRIGREGQELINQIKKGKPVVELNDPSSPLDVGQFRLGGEPHLWMYDQYSLGRLLRQAQFESVCQKSANDSYFQNFKEYHLDIEINGEVKKPDSLFMEAIKPRQNGWEQIIFNAQENSPKIIHLSTFDIQGGAAKAGYRLHQALLGSGHRSLMIVKEKLSDDPTVLQINQPSDLDCYTQSLLAIQTHGINTHRTSISNTLFSLPYPGLDLSQLPEIQDADVINLHWVSYGFLSLTSINQLLQLNKPIIWTLHDMSAFTGGCHYSAGCRGYEETCSNCPQLSSEWSELATLTLQDKIELLNSKNLTIITPSQWLYQCATASQVFRHQTIKQIPYSISIDIFKPEKKSIAKQKLGIRPEVCTLLFVAHNRDEIRKGFAHLIQALKYCLDDDLFWTKYNQQEIKLVCLGAGESDWQVPGLEITFLKYEEDENTISQVYSASDLLLLSSLEDNLPNTVLEAMGCGTPVLAYEVGGIPDMVEHTTNGYLVTLGNTREFAETIIDFINTFFFNTNSIVTMGLNARKTIEDKFTASLQAKQYLKVYQELLNNNSSKNNICESKNKKSSLSLHIPRFEQTLGNNFQAAFNQFSVQSLHTKLMEIEIKTELNLKSTQNNLEQAQIALSHLQTAHNICQADLSATQAAMIKLESDLNQTNLELEHLKILIAEMETSKFWKARIAWFKLKEIFKIN
ncbi:glycosyltransferase [Synechococcus sp. PCC 6312]|uniref:glycosyltransferase n=1 Tax=Synechococcus sp. (strain ATCC 27167 / PCC 6312) TaxID=195253 RepID=UPI00029EEAA2|nr:glycosyltransferase [Synechococcus sp. PCC 6312]AFY62263.1 glycosyltransferase [Synechococcus sp. PCC 6312]